MCHHLLWLCNNAYLGNTVERVKLIVESDNHSLPSWLDSIPCLIPMPPSSTMYPLQFIFANLLLFTFVAILVVALVCLATTIKCPVALCTSQYHGDRSRRRCSGTLCVDPLYDILNGPPHTNKYAAAPLEEQLPQNCNNYILQLLLLLLVLVLVHILHIIMANLDN